MTTLEKYMELASRSLREHKETSLTEKEIKKSTEKIKQQLESDIAILLKTKNAHKEKK